MLKSFRLYYSPYFLSRYHIKKSIEWAVKKYKFKGSLLDIGCGQKPYQKIFTQVSNYKGIDFKNFSINKDLEQNSPDLFFDEKYKKTLELPFEDSSFDNTTAFQVLEHHSKPNKLVSEMVRVTKPGGYILITVPFLGGIHEVPHDYQRYTSYGLKNLFSDLPVKNIEIKGIGSLASTIALLFNEYINYLATKKGIYYVLAIILYPIDMSFQYLSIVLDKFIVAEHLVSNYCLVARKK